MNKKIFIIVAVVLMFLNGCASSKRWSKGRWRSQKDTKAEAAEVSK